MEMRGGNWVPFHTGFSSELQFLHLGLLLNKMKAEMLNHCCQQTAFSKNEMPIVLQTFSVSYLPCSIGHFDIVKVSEYL